MTALITKTKANSSTASSKARFVELTLSPVEAGYIRLLSAVLRESEEEVVTDLLVGRWKAVVR